jgi:membrane protein required for colicin V production
MNYIDIIILIAFAWAAYRGITKGFIIMAASLLALILGIWGAVRFSDFTSALLVERLNIQTKYLSLISFTLTFIAIVICILLLGRLFDRLANAVALGLVNRIAGLIFSLAKTAFILSILLVVLNAIDKQVPFIPEEHKQGSFFYDPLSKLAPAVFPYLNFETVHEDDQESGLKEYSL